VNSSGLPLRIQIFVIGLKLELKPPLFFSSAGASSPALQTNIGRQASRVDSSSQVAAHAYHPSHSFDAAGTAMDSAPSCRPWERGDLLRRLATFKPSTWASKPKAASSLACAQRGWVNIDLDKIECESCGAHLIFNALMSWSPVEGMFFLGSLL